MTAHVQILENIALADCAFLASGDTPSELFEAAAQAVIETMANPQTIACTWTHRIERQEETIESLLFDWLNDLVYLKDAEGVLFHDAAAEVHQDPQLGTWQVKGRLRGEAIDHSRQELRGDVKAVTKHLYEVKQEGTTWVALVVLDL